MLLKPLTQDHIEPNEVQSFDPVRSVLEEAGIINAEAKEEKSKIKRFREALNNNGVSLDNCARVLAEMLTDKADKAKGLDIALKVHGIMREADKNPVPSINIVFGSQDNREVNALLVPRS